jgi:hypothetical protein
MKCDVCQTKIPLGEDTCPNCGYKVRKSHASTYNASGRTHEHIHLEVNKTKKPLNFKWVTKLLTTFAIIIVVIGLIFGVITGINHLEEYHISIDDIFGDEYNDYEDMSFQDVLDEDADKEDTVLKAQEQKQKIERYLYQNKYTDLSTQEHVNALEDDLGLNAYMYTTAKKNGYHLSIQVNFIHGKENSCRFIISGDMKGSASKRKFQLKKDDIYGITQLLGIEESYQIFKQKHPLMKYDKKEKRYQFSNYDDIEIYMTEENSNNKDQNTYFFYYSIRKRM